MLEEVRIEFLIGQREVRLHVVGKFHDLQIHALFFQRRLNELENIGVGHRCCAHRKRDSLGGLRGFVPAAGESESQNGCAAKGGRESASLHCLFLRMLLVREQIPVFNVCG